MSNSMKRKCCCCPEGTPWYYIRAGHLAELPSSVSIATAPVSTRLAWPHTVHEGGSFDCTYWIYDAGGIVEFCDCAAENYPACSSVPTFDGVLTNETVDIGWALQNAIYNFNGCGQLTLAATGAGVGCLDGMLVSATIRNSSGGVPGQTNGCGVWRLTIYTCTVTTGSVANGVANSFIVWEGVSETLLGTYRAYSGAGMAIEIEVS